MRKKKTKRGCRGGKGRYKPPKPGQAPEVQAAPADATGANVAAQAGNGASPPGKPEPAVRDTALFSESSKTRSDANLVRRAVRQRWDTDKRLSKVVIQKVLTLAAGLEWQGPKGEVVQHEFTTPQLLGAAKLALDVERQNQTEEHHADRMDYAQEALRLRGGGVMARAQVNVSENDDGGKDVGVGISIYLPDNSRDPLETTIEEPRLPGEPSDG